MDDKTVPDDRPEDKPVEDQTANFSALEELSDTFYETLVNSMQEGVYLVNRERMIAFWNKGAEKLSGYSKNEVQGRFCGDRLLSHVDADGRLLCGIACPLEFTMKDGEPREADVFLKHRDGHRVPVHVSASPVYDQEGKIIGAVEYFHDITPQLASKMRIEQLTLQANTDALTGLANRRFMEEMLADSLYYYRRHKQPCGVLFVDIDEMKEINDKLGHDAGDKAIQSIGKTLELIFRSGDLVARWGGDEFLVLLREVDAASLESVRDKAEKTAGTAELSGEYKWGKISVSIGGALIREDDSIKSLVERADKAMYAKKQAKLKTSGKNSRKK